MASVRKRTWTHNGQAKEAWVVAYTDGSGKRRLKTFDKKKDADKHRTKVEAEIGEDAHTPDASTVTVKALCEEFLRDLDRRVADGRMEYGYTLSYRSMTRHLTPVLGRELVKSLTVRSAEAFYESMRRSISPQTAKKYTQQAKRLMEFAKKRAYTKANPFAVYLGELRNVGARTIRTFDHPQIVTLLQVADIRPTTYHHRLHLAVRCFVNLAAFCGLRFGEIAGLTSGSVNLSDRLLHIRHGLTRHDRLKGPKTRAGVRDIPLPLHLVTMLTEWRERFHVENDRGLFFVTVQHRGWSVPHFHRPWKALVDRAGLTDGGSFRFHALRHFAASWMIENGLPLMDVAALLGHSKFDMTLQVYAHPVIGGNRRHEAMDRMAGALLPPPTRQGCDMAL